ncbi:MAG: HAMP domain-containing histidine kinase [Bacteroidales bacterium]|nr:HAMP domain-containing histidine kinase [Bacteroidales bacterium]
MKANFYTHKKRWKIALAVMALIIVCASIYYTNILVKRFAAQETKQIEMWADAVQSHVELMKYTETFFDEVSEQEQKRVELLALAYKSFLESGPDENTSIYLEIIRSNISIPVVIADNNGKIRNSINLPEKFRDKKYFDDEMVAEFNVYPPIKIDLYGKTSWLFYNESLIYTELKSVLDGMFQIFVADVTDNAVGAPVIIVDSVDNKVLAYGKLDSLKMQDKGYVARQLQIMQEDHFPIKVNYLNGNKVYIYYRGSDLLQQMRYFPVIQILIFAFFFVIAYLLFSYARRSEQNQVWAGMAKETAHQIGTPLSSLMGWVELLKLEEKPFIGTSDMESDIERLKTITERFSKIGSIPTLEPSDVVEVTRKTMRYLQKRFSSKFDFQIQLPEREIVVPLNAALFGWVLENLTKNAIDTMTDHGSLTIEMTEDDANIFIDVTDTGKGMPRSMFTQVFKPGYTSKKRGWGLGLSLAKRIVEDYHKGKIFVKSSTIGQGTTFRIILEKNL